MTFAAIGDLKTHRITHNLIYVVKMLDVDKQSGASTASQITANEVAQCIPVRKGDIVLQAGVFVQVACTGAASGDIGTGDLVNQFADGIALDQTVATAFTAGGAPKIITVADTIDLKVLEADVTAGKMQVFALILRNVAKL